MAKATLYRRYPTKNHLALAFLRRREELWTHAWLQRQVERGPGPPARFRHRRFEGCAFVNVMLECGGEDHVIRTAATAHLATILMKGSIIAASEGDRNAARRARAMGRLLPAEKGVDIALRGRRTRAAASAAAPG